MSSMKLQMLATHSRQVELKLPVDTAANTQFAFPDQPDLRYARIIAIEVFTRTDAAVTQPSRLPLITDAQLPMLSLILETNDADNPDDPKNVAEWKAKGKSQAGRYRDTQQNQKYIPFSALHRIQNATPAPFVRDLFFMYNTYVTWQKSFVVMSAPFNNDTALGISLMVYYSWLDIHGIPIDRT